MFGKLLVLESDRKVWCQGVEEEGVSGASGRNRTEIRGVLASHWQGGSETVIGTKVTPASCQPL